MHAMMRRPIDIISLDLNVILRSGVDYEHVTHTGRPQFAGE